jgi:WD40 repeat protein
MKKFSILVAKVFLLIMLISCVGNRPASTSDRDTIATIVAEMLTALPSATPAPSPTATFSQPSHEYVVYGVKTVVYSMSGDEAFQQKIPLYQYINQHTDIFSYSVEQHNANLIFSDETLPIFILNTYGGGETAIHDIVAASPTSGKLYARMMPRDQYTSYQDAGSLYELSTDGTNNYRKIFDFDSPVNFVLSPDVTKIAYISDNSLVVRAMDSGDEIGRMDLDEYKYNWIKSISWAPDSKTILIDIAAGEASVTPVEPYTKTNGCYLVNIYDKTMNKLNDPLFQYPMELIPGFMTDPFSYSYFPRSNRLIGIARKYEETYYFVELYSVDLEGSNLIKIPIGHNAAVWEVNISPNEQYIAYPCLQNVCVTHIQDNLSEVASQPITTEEGADQEQTVIGWLEK